MATAERTSNAHLTLLHQQGEELNFYQAIRVLERALPEGDALRFAVVNCEAFHPNFIAAIRRHVQADNSKITKVDVNGFGILGMQGPLPTCFSELLRFAQVKGQEGAESPEAFLDVFHDRLLELLYDIKKQLNPMLFNQVPEEHLLFTLFSSISGLSMQSTPVKSDRLAQFAPILANRRVDYSHLVQLLRQAFDCEVEVTPNQGGWCKLPQSMQAKLVSGTGEHGGIRLGQGLGVGQHYWDNQVAIAVNLNVPDIETCYDLLPSGQQHNKLQTLLTFLSDGRYRFYISLEIDWSAIPKSYLSVKKQMVLGKTAWLKHTEKDHVDHPLPRFTVYPKMVECGIRGGEV